MTQVLLHKNKKCSAVWSSHLSQWISPKLDNRSKGTHRNSICPKVHQGCQCTVFLMQLTIIQ